MCGVIESKPLQGFIVSPYFFIVTNSNYQQLTAIIQKLFIERE